MDHKKKLLAPSGLPYASVIKQGTVICKIIYTVGVVRLLCFQTLYSLSTPTLYSACCFTIMLFHITEPQYGQMKAYIVSPPPPPICSSCTEWRRSDLLLLSLQQEAGGATREVTEEASRGSTVCLTDALDEEEEGGEELGG